MATCFYFLSVDQDVFSDRSNLELTIGHIEKINKDVRFKANSQYFWSKARQSGQVYIGDSLFTGAKSQAVVQLSSGNRLYISENSLIKLKKRNSSTAIDIPFGEIRAENLTDELTVSDCGKLLKIQAQGAQFTLKKMAECGHLELNVSKGNVKVNKVKVQKLSTVRKNADTKGNATLASLLQERGAVLMPAEVQAASDKRIIASAPADVEKSKAISVESLKENPKIVIAGFSRVKDNKYKFQVGKDKKITVKLEPPKNIKVDEISKYQVELDEDANFIDPLVVTSKVPEINIDQKLLAEYKKVFMRSQVITNQDEKSSYSEVAQIEKSYPKIKIKDDQIVKEFKAKTSKDEGAPQEFKVEWSAVPEAKSYVLETVNKENPEDISKQKTRAPASVVTVPQAGNYELRVKALDKKGRQISSTQKQGEIVYKKIFDLITPQSEMTKKDLHYYFQKGDGKLIRITWDPVPRKENVNELKYVVSISTDPDFKENSQEFETFKSNLLVRNSLSPGQYYWRVKYIQDEQTSDWSQVGSFNVSGRKSEDKKN